MCGLRTSLNFLFIKIYFQALRILLCQIKHYHTIPYACTCIADQLDIAEVSRLIQGEIVSVDIANNSSCNYLF